MQIGIPAETVVGENRVAATPETVKKLISAGHSVVIERRAGVKAAYIDSAYEQVGATLTDDAYTGSQMILKVRAPQGAEIQKLAPNTSVIAMFDPYRNTELDQFASQQVSAFALELLPRTLSRAQNMDVLSSQANLSGYSQCNIGFYIAALRRNDSRTISLHIIHTCFLVDAYHIIIRA
jgi:NAD(P) transhydrogenase subunit alpha